MIKILDGNKKHLGTKMFEREIWIPVPIIFSLTFKKQYHKSTLTDFLLLESKHMHT